MKPPSSSLRATKTSSSSSTDSVWSTVRVCCCRAGTQTLQLTIEKGNKLLAGALGAESKGNSREPVDGVETEEDVVVLGMWSAPVDQAGQPRAIIVIGHRTFSSSIRTAMGYSSSLVFVASAMASEAAESRISPGKQAEVEAGEGMVV